RDVGRVLQAIEERLLPASFHGSILLVFPLAAHALDRGAGALVDGAAAVLERRLGLGLPLRPRLGRARLRELPLELLGGVGAGRRLRGLAVPAGKSSEVHG